MNSHIRAAATGALVLTLTTLHQPAAALTHAADAVTATSSPASARQHRVFGTIAAFGGQKLIVQLRNGRLVSVNAAQAFARNRVAQPLYRGKPVVITGALGSDGTLYASGVNRASPQRGSWGFDR